MKAALAARGFEDQLERELGDRIKEQFGRLFLFESGPNPVWAQNIWLDAKTKKIKSIREAADFLKSIQRSWSLHPFSSHRRAALIKEQLPPIKQRRFEFLAEIPRGKMGAWTLVDSETLLYSAECSHPLPEGEIEFIENKKTPPSRAYLKLWELFTVEGKFPQAEELVLDLGSSPGGWTWVLDQLGCQVISVDKAPLAKELQLSSRVQYLSESAFGLDPAKIGREVDWLFSDIICYPDRLLGLVKKWQGYARNFVCTIKLQGPMDPEIISEFAQIEGAKIRHLYHNKNELTWTQIL